MIIVPLAAAFVVAVIFAALVFSFLSECSFLAVRPAADTVFSDACASAPPMPDMPTGSCLLVEAPDALPEPSRPSASAPVPASAPQMAQPEQPVESSDPVAPVPVPADPSPVAPSPESTPEAVQKPVQETNTSTSTVLIEAMSSLKLRMPPRSLKIN